MEEWTYSIIDVDTWKRKEHFEKWVDFDEPFHGVTVLLDITHCYNNAIANNYKIFPRYMYHFLLALNDVEPMKYRLLDGKPIVYDEVLSGLVVMREDDTFAYGRLKKNKSFTQFSEALELEKLRVKNRGSLHDEFPLLNIIHFSVLPWTNFISLSHARNYGEEDSIPKITIGKISEDNGKYVMPISIHVHHALMDGKDVADFINTFQHRLTED